MSKKDEFKLNRQTTISFSFDSLGPIRNLYHNIKNNSLDDNIDIGIKSHEDYGGDFIGIKMKWYFAKSPEAMQVFRDVLDGCELLIARDIIGFNRSQIRVLQANIIEIEGGYPEGRWHSDFTDEELGLNESGTLLTPLFSFKPYFGGLEISTVLRSEKLDYDQYASVYKYKEGEAILFDGTGTIHRTQSYMAQSDDVRLLVCWQFGTIRSETKEVYERIGVKNGDPMFMYPHEIN